MLALTDDKIPHFVIEYDLPASVRFNEVWHHFKDPLLDMENYFYSNMSAEIKAIFSDQENLSKLVVTQPDVYFAMDSLASMLGLPLSQVLAVNAITDMSTYCTSIIAQNLDGNVTHVRNLDFGHTEVMR